MILFFFSETCLNNLKIIHLCFFSVLDKHQRRVATLGEMIHTASLIHDDVVDSSDRRRGKPAAAMKWGPKKVKLISSQSIRVQSNKFCSRQS